MGNVISGNTQSGVFVQDVGSNDVVILGNYIGTNADGTAALGRQGTGVRIVGSTGVLVGGAAGGRGNVISGNVFSGVDISGGSGNTVAGNKIGTDASGAAAVPNRVGIRAEKTADLVIGGLSARERNIISGNAENGIVLLGGSRPAIQGNYIGTNADGSAALANGLQGIATGFATQGADKQLVSDLVVAGNVISGNSTYGVFLDDVAGATIKANFIGTDARGTAKVPNAFSGVIVVHSNNVTIGGADPSARNVISGNTQDGIALSAGNPVTIQGNYIGTDVTGTVALGNGEEGVRVSGTMAGKTGHVIGGSTAAAGNVISGNGDAGVLMRIATGNLLGFNRIGTNAAGTAALPNAVGVRIEVAGNTVQDNLISGNTNQGVLIAAADNKLLRNTVGLNLAGTAALPNANGVEVAGGGGNEIGSTADHNTISGNTGAGVLVGSASRTKISGTQILGNRIGTSADGTAGVGNGLGGVIIADGAEKTAVGGNLISGNQVVAANGLQVQGNATGTQIVGNVIGLRLGGTGLLANADGILIKDTAANTTVAGNFIAGNALDGIKIVKGINIVGGPATTTIEGNWIGLDDNGAAAPNLRNGVNVLAGSGTRIAGNVISGNAGNGVEISGANVTKTNSLTGNLIGTDPEGTAAVPNGMAGVLVDDLTAQGHELDIEGNTISGNANEGVLITTSASVSLGGNVIGLNKLGTAALPNGSDGVHVTSSSSVQIGAATKGNTIAGNTRDGVRIDGASEVLTIRANTIGLRVGAGQKEANGGNGITITDTASGILVGGGAEEANIVSGNTLNGIEIDANTTFTQVLSNVVGLDGTQTVALGNGGDGILVLGKGVRINGNLTSGGGAIAGNKGNGIQVSGANASGTIIRGCHIGINGPGTAVLPNALDGILVTNHADRVVIGGPTLHQLLQDGNVVSGSTKNGIEVTDAAGTKIDSNTVLANEVGVFVTGTSKDITILGNRIANNTGSGVNFDDLAEGLTMTSNTITGNETGVLVKGQGVTIGGAHQANTILANKTAGIDVEGTARKVTIAGNFIGTTKDNLVNQGNGTDGIVVIGLATVTIGGNVISANKGNGIHLDGVIPLGDVTQTIQILGNLIGTTVQGKGLLGLGNTRDGVFLEASGKALIQGNTISGNGANGVELVNGSNGNVITSNKIGVGFDGKTQVKNGGFGVWVHQNVDPDSGKNTDAASSNNTIGGKAAGAGNVIGYNAKGVVIGDNPKDSSQKNAILGDEIFQNISDGALYLIDLGNNDDPTYKPSGTAGPNLLEAPPTLTTAKVNGSDLTVTGSLKGTLPNTTFRIEIFAAEPTFGPFKRFLGFVNVTTDGSGNVVDGFSVRFQGVAVPKGAAVSATATDPNGNTTGFAKAITAS
jgi:parallel beta-helix repeat protein